MPCKTKLSNYDCLLIRQFTYSQDFREKKITDENDAWKATKLRDMFQEQVQYHIYNLHLFEDVVNGECPYDADNIVLLKGEITYMKRVTTATRIMAGAMGGRARVDVDIHLVDSQTGEVVGAASVKGTSKGVDFWLGVHGAPTEEAFENAAQIIAEFIRNSY